MPVFGLTHHEREPLTLSDTTFTFVTDGIESALEQARGTAAGKDVTVGGGADVINQYLAAGLVDELELNIVPLVLGWRRPAVRGRRPRPDAGAGPGRRGARGDSPEVPPGASYTAMKPTSSRASSSSCALGVRRTGVIVCAGSNHGAG